MNDLRYFVNPFPPSSNGFQFYASLEPSLARLSLVRFQSDHPRSLLKELRMISLEDLLETVAPDRLMGQAVRAGLLLAAEAWDEAHDVVQDLDTVEGSYWHGILHRREPDAGNAKYWFRRVGTHPVFDQLGNWESRMSFPPKHVLDTLAPSGTWDPFTFIDLCVGSTHFGSSDLSDLLVTLQVQEIRLLLEYCIQNATKK